MDDDNWSKKAQSLANQQLNLDIVQNIERRRTIATELRHRKAKMFKDDPKHPLAVTQSELDANEDNIVFDWEQNHKNSFADQYRQAKTFILTKVP